MDYFLKERIGNPQLFTGRVEELRFYLKWIDGIKEEKSMSTAMLARRKMGKTALMERMFNIIFYKNDGVIPFYYEVKEGKKWAVDFSIDFFLTFIYQYIAFKSRNPRYLRPENLSSLEVARQTARKEGLDYLTGVIDAVEHAAAQDYVDQLWKIVRDAPQDIAFRQNERFIQLIDEFQFLNSEIYWDKAKTNLADDFAAGYSSTADSKIAPLLVSGSWGDLPKNFLNKGLIAGFKQSHLENMPDDKIVKVNFEYSWFRNN